MTDSAAKIDSGLSFYQGAAVSNAPQDVGGLRCSHA
jgi:hypothetical protein